MTDDRMATVHPLPPVSSTGTVVRTLNNYAGPNIWRDVIPALRGFDATRKLQPIDDAERLLYSDRFIAYGDHNRSVEYRFSWPEMKWVAWAVVDDQGTPLV
jgi:hypothetical protein